MRKVRLISVFVVVAMLSGLCAVSAQEKITFKFAHIAPIVHADHRAAMHFKAYVESRSNGRVEVSVHPAGQLGGERAMIEGVQMGMIEMGFFTAAVFTNFIPQIAVTNLPFIFPDQKTAYRVLDSDIGDRIFSHFPEKGFTALAWGENGFRDFSNSKRAIHAPGDMVDLKMRSIESPLFLNSYDALGVNAVAIPWPDTFTALQQKVVDGADLPYNSMALAKWLEVQQYVTLSGWIYEPMPVVANTDWFQSLPEDIQQIIRDGAYELQLTNRALNAEDRLKTDADAKARGIEVVTLTPGERQAFREKMIPVYDAWKEKIGGELVDMVLEATK
ncbi:C4-dicarboxylate ABC transporter substrate-binding protein [candidate division KSB3 bacterium]|uniref:C4-dicarboxylate ABC transporter substrate-binding protein n=1 Tax=candidate division KSB3 bacterium TaxID=2044937 RepID=A0A2G6E2F0_9BACT|nr:MAG: C4-dicarboxylate ABC transporter substrate-binding protein [candidate division KSB3 bacterium]PIE28760.1 MAG: C4-dicarboxylate ABC transporter substrate-binding protein [candidate division KSB3 bacterium]